MRPMPRQSAKPSAGRTCGLSRSRRSISKASCRCIGSARCSSANGLPRSTRVRGLLTEFGIVAGKGYSEDGRAPPEDGQGRRRSLASRGPCGDCRGIRSCRCIEQADRCHRGTDRHLAQELGGQPPACLRPGCGTASPPVRSSQCRRRKQFQSARHFAAWLGLDAKNSCQRREGAHRQDQQRRRSLSADVLIHGARAIVGTSSVRSDA